MQIPFRLLDLPPEIIVLILDLLDVKVIAACRQICRTIRAIIDTNAVLQYQLALAIHGLEDARCSRSPAELLQLVSVYSKAWDTFRWSDDFRVPQERGHTWELFGNVLAQCGPREAQTMKFVQLPSKYRSIERKEWTLPPEFAPFSIRDFGMDPSQDLLVLVEAPSWHGNRHVRPHHFHLRTVSTGENHPLASKPDSMSVVPPIRSSASYTLQVCGTYLGALVHHQGGHTIMVVWNWKTGVLKAHIESDFEAFVFLSETHIVLTLTVDFAEEDTVSSAERSLAVIDFAGMDGSEVTLDNVTPCLFLRLPRLSYRAYSLNLSIRSDPTPGWSPRSDLGIPFYHNRHDRVFFVTDYIHGRNIAHAVSLYIPGRTFERVLEEARTTNNWVVSWADWGPEGARMLQHPLLPSPVWECYVFGSKCVSSDIAPGKNGKFSVDVHDFNQARIRQCQAMGTDTEGDLENKPLTELVTTPSVISNGALFSQDVQTCLPYRRLRVLLEEDEAESCAPMCYEDGLVIINTELGSYRVLAV